VTIVAVASAKASPGATTLALALAATWPAAAGDGLRAVVVEADPDGGSLAARFGLGYEPGLVTLATAARRGLDDATFFAHLQTLGDGVGVLCGPPSAQHAAAALGGVADRLAVHLAALAGVTALVDVGRLSAGSPALPLARRAGVCLVVARPRLDEVQHLAARARSLVAAGCELGLVCVGERPYAPVEVAASAGLVLVGVVADDGRGATALAGGPATERLLRRSPLWRTASALSVHVANRVSRPDPPDVTPDVVADAARVGGTVRVSVSRAVKGSP